MRLRIQRIRFANSEQAFRSPLEIADMVGIRTQVVQDVLLEHYRYAPGPAQQTGRHAHAEYQVCLSWNVDGEYWYRGAYRTVPARSLSILHPGEVHSSRDLARRTVESAFSVYYLPAALIKDALISNGISSPDLEPFFEDAISVDPVLFNAFAQVDSVWSDPGSLLLHRQSILHRAVARLLRSHPHLAKHHSDAPRRTGPAVERARAYIFANYLNDISFSTLTDVSGLSAFHLARRFRQEVGLAPHQYQTQLRIGHAQRLIAGGDSLSVVASAVGFCDQSHLGRHFKRLVKVPPGVYRKGRNDRNL